MKLIAHRGNINGRNKSEENKPSYIKQALDQGFDVEVDVWLMDGIYFGHDAPQYESDMDFLLNNHERLWIHCKNLSALNNLSDFFNLNVFWHEQDKFTLTSQGFIWTYPHNPICSKSVVVCKDSKYSKYQECHGVCSDFLR
tara:strand:- start:456 stop:878 length:423 start_codon:yes stop_codon:yes gene_type:complete